jgi:hypothetical protein
MTRKKSELRASWIDALERGLPARSAQAGVTVMLVVAFMGVFLVIMGTITSYVFQQSRYGRALLAREQALHVAEAGLEYYKWFLAHNPGNLTNGTGGPGPYTYTVEDPEGGVVGTAGLTVVGNSQCGVLQSIDLTSRGVASANPGFARSVSVRYMQPSVASYSSVLNSNVRYTAASITGAFVSNGGIRMDGGNNSTVSSATSSFLCDSSMGCSPSETKPGVFGSGSNSSLWRYPVASIDFPGMMTDLETLRGYAQASGLYFYDAAVSGLDSKGFRLVMKSDGTIDVYTVTGTTAISNAYDSIRGYHTDYDIITSQTLLGTYTPPSGCALIYVRGTTWLEGTVAGRYTILAADPGSHNPDILLANNISYATSDGTTGLTAIAERSVRIPLNSPDTLAIRGIFVARNGYWGRDYYTSTPSGYSSYVLRSTLNVLGTIVSTSRPAVCWSSGGTCVQGYTNRTYNYEQVLAFAPPPFTPIVSTDYGFVRWREE